MPTSHSQACSNPPIDQLGVLGFSQKGKLVFKSTTSTKWHIDVAIPKMKAVLERYCIYYKVCLFLSDSTTKEEERNLCIISFELFLSQSNVPMLISLGSYIDCTIPNLELLYKYC